MMRFNMLARLAVILTALVMMTVMSPAQASRAPVDQPSAHSSFDGYRTMAVSLGILGGTALAVILTSGQLFPFYTLIDKIAEDLLLIYSRYETMQDAAQMLGAISIASYVDALHKP